MIILDTPHGFIKFRYSVGKAIKSCFLEVESLVVERMGVIMGNEPTVFVIDNDQAVREGLSLLIKSVGLNVETYSSAQEYLEAFNPSRPGCLVLDVRMPGMSGLELQETLHRRNVKIPIIMISGHGDVPMAVQTVKMGAVDFIEKPFRDQVLLDRIQKAIFKDSETRQEQDELNSLTVRADHLTVRERQVMTLVVAG
ncbi:MAG: response regulator transcription factor, partial [Planctomycetes bacterium]|nr:response regulator transcription factor [Planctomycetota bacterium]